MTGIFLRQDQTETTESSGVNQILNQPLTNLQVDSNFININAVAEDANIKSAAAEDDAAAAASSASAAQVSAAAAAAALSSESSVAMSIALGGG
jgi:hypothetical protein